MRKVGVEPTATGNAHRWIGGAPQRRLSFAWRPQTPSITRRPANPRPGPTHVNTQLAGWLLPDAANCQPSANLNLNFIQKKTKIQVGKSSNTRSLCQIVDVSRRLRFVGLQECLYVAGHDFVDSTISTPAVCPRFATSVALTVFEAACYRYVTCDADDLSRSDQSRITWPAKKYKQNSQSYQPARTKWSLM